MHSPVVVNRDHGEAAWEHIVIPDGEWDFVLIDGPAGVGEITASCDLVNLASRMRPGAQGFIDHRWRTAMLVRECAGDLLRMHYCLSLESFLFERR